jgi:hypothetical protein
MFLRSNPLCHPDRSVRFVFPPLFLQRKNKAEWRDLLLASWQECEPAQMPVVPEGTLPEKCMPTQDSAALHPGLTAAPPLRRSADDGAITDAPEQTSLPKRSKENVCPCEARKEKLPIPSNRMARRERGDAKRKRKSVITATASYAAVLRTALTFDR